MEFIIQFVQDQPWFGVAAAAVVLASSIAALTPTPKEGTFLAKAYKIIDLLALNIGKAKEKAAAKEAAKKDADKK
ncbi:MAG: hypothetical protein CMJ25_10130 [Phycisphaerae bacterium]|nr:hypothetical protein [Phycisphaerae bacterium]|tara:strand:- start:2070 stop:2294 length:225 start_codon:yes stop_codon:yes gene_type:complete